MDSRCAGDDADPRAEIRRLPTWSLAAGANDWLQAGFAALTSKSNELEQRAGG